MLDRSEVLHVARLARLRLTDDEVERMSREEALASAPAVAEGGFEVPSPGL